MARFFLVLLVLYLIFQVARSIAQYDSPDYSGGDGNRLWDFDEINAREPSLYKRYETFEDGPPRFIPRSETKCYMENMQCRQQAYSNQRQVCAYSKKYGLVNFRRECDVFLENCLIQSYEIWSRSKSPREPYFYNGLAQNCEYYLGQTYTVPDAVQMYYLYARVDQMRRNGKLFNEIAKEISTTTENNN